MILSYAWYGYSAYTLYDMSNKLNTAWTTVKRVQDVYYWMLPIKKYPVYFDGDDDAFDDWIVVEATS